jgi:hypothetical protein
MNARYRTALLVLLFGFALAAVAAPVSAASPKALHFAPGEPYGLPSFGFSSSTVYGFGERVVYVRPGGRAFYLGLEPGDVILSLNGYNLTYRGSWNDALSRALYSGSSRVRLKIRDVRTGRIFVKETFVGYADGPVTPYFKTAKPQSHVIHHKDFHNFNDFNHHHNFNHFNKGPQKVSIKDIGNLFD